MKYKNRYGEVVEFEDPQSFLDKRPKNQQIMMYVTKNWAPFIYKELINFDRPPIENTMLNNSWRTFRTSPYKSHSVINGLKAFRNILDKEFVKFFNESEQQKISPQERGNFIWERMSSPAKRSTDLLYLMKFNSNIEGPHSFDIATEAPIILNLLHEAYKYNPELEQQQKKEAAKVQELDNHIQQLNKYLGQQNSKLTRTIVNLKQEQNRLIAETQNAMQSQANNFVRYKQNTENELSNIRQNNNLILDKLKNRMKRRMLSDAPEMRASYNFFEDIFAGNK